MRTAAAALVLALALAGCGGDENATTTNAKRPARQDTDGRSSDAQKKAAKPSHDQDINAKSTAGRAIEETAESWAPLFAASADKWACRYMTQPACEQVACQTVAGEPIEDCKSVPGGFRTSFKDATVETIAIKGDRATAELSNGKTIGLVLLTGHEAGDLWRIDQVGGNA